MRLENRLENLEVRLVVVDDQNQGTVHHRPDSFRPRASESIVEQPSEGA